MNNTPQLKGTATHFIELYKNKQGYFSITNKRLYSTPIRPIKELEPSLQVTKGTGCKTIAVWHITPHPFIDINQFKTN